MGEQDLNDADRELLDLIDRVALHGETIDTEPTSLEGLAVQLAHSAPQASNDFQSLLLSRLQVEPQARVPQTIIATTDLTKKDQKSTRVSRPQVLHPALAKVPARSTGYMTTRGRGRYAQLATGMVGLVFMVSILVAMVAMLNQRVHVGNGLQPPLGVPTPARASSAIATLYPSATATGSTATTIPTTMAIVVPTEGSTLSKSPTPVPTYIYNSPTPVPDCGLVWSTVPISSSGALRGVAAVSANDVWAVGHTFESPKANLIQHWDGAKWSSMPTPRTGSGDNLLYAVAALAPDDVWAVGQYGSAPIQTLTLHWNGKAWKIVSSPDIQGSDSTLAAIAAISENDVWAAGSSYSPGIGTLVPGVQRKSSPLLEHWNGHAWSIVATPAVAEQSSLSAIAAIATSDIWAGGSTSTCDAQYPDWCTSKSFFLHWNGRSWAQYSGPLPEGIFSMGGMAAVSSNDVWAAGSAWSGDPDVNDVILHWDGNTWSRATELQGGTNGGLRAMTALSGHDVWAIGGAIDPIITHWNGNEWVPVFLPPKKPSSAVWEGGLYAVDAISPTDMWAVGGFYLNEGRDQAALVLHYTNVPCNTVTPGK